ncbi:MAG: hypothetical protein ACXVA9_03725 [Bdellovibrionales bacterium]
MDMDRHDQGEPQVLPVGETRIKSSNRMVYEAEVLFLKNQNGDLEVIRERLGLSRRKICQLLLVDPSAWTRWTSPGNEAPPHIYRALDWYLAGMEKDPEYRRLAKRFAEWLSHEKDHEGRLASLESLLQNKPRPPHWREIASPILAFLGGILLMFFALRLR